MLFLFELTGTAAFAFSGAAAAVHKKMDIFGCVILGMTTACGGGIIRDLLLGITPPSAFTHPVYAACAAFVSILFFITAPKANISWSSAAFRTAHRRFFSFLLLIMDSVGLGIFTSAGVITSLNRFPEQQEFLAVFVGTVTGVGGGVLRDVFSCRIPSVFVKDFYACAAVLGAVLCIAMRSLLGETAALISGTALTVLLRLLAVFFKWHLPRAD